MAAIFGCGEQGRAQLAALAAVRRLSRAYAFDADAPRTASFAAEMSQHLDFPVEAAAEPRSAARQSDLVVTCTTSRRAFLGPEDVAPGAFVAGVGADNPEKQELDPALLASSKLVVDLLDQCAVMGDLHHALAAGALSREDVHAELAEVVAGSKPGRESAEEVIVFDSTGLAIEDVAAAAAVYEKAEATGAGNRIDLSS